MSEQRKIKRELEKLDLILRIHQNALCSEVDERLLVNTCPQYLAYLNELENIKSVIHQRLKKHSHQEKEADEEEVQGEEGFKDEEKEKFKEELQGLTSSIFTLKFPTVEIHQEVHQKIIAPKPMKKNIDPVLKMSYLFPFISATGYTLFELLHDVDDLDEVMYFTQSFDLIQDIIKFVALKPFQSPEVALECIQLINKGCAPVSMVDFLAKCIDEYEDKNSLKIGVDDDSLGMDLNLGLPYFRNAAIIEIFRGLREFLPDFLGTRDESYATKLVDAQRGLAHQHSAARSKFAKFKADYNIVQAVATLDRVDAHLFSMSMRLREWYSIFFPELQRIVFDNLTYAKVVKLFLDAPLPKMESAFQLVGDSRIADTIDEPSPKMQNLKQIVGDATIADLIEKASRYSIGDDQAEIDRGEILSLANQIISYSQYRSELHNYLNSTMTKIAPNLGVLTGQIGARLIARAGGLHALAKLPASTIQIMGAEKAFFRALKTGTNTPKHGIIFHSEFVSRAGLKDKGRVARSLANRAAIAARIDAYSDDMTEVYGNKLREQMNERLEYINSGVEPRKNIEVMREATEEHEREVKKRKMDSVIYFANNMTINEDSK